MEEDYSFLGVGGFFSHDTVLCPSDLEEGADDTPDVASQISDMLFHTTTSVPIQSQGSQADMLRDLAAFPVAAPEPCWSSLEPMGMSQNSLGTALQAVNDAAMEVPLQSPQRLSRTTPTRSPPMKSLLRSPHLLKSPSGPPTASMLPGLPSPHRAMFDHTRHTPDLLPQPTREAAPPPHPAHAHHETLEGSCQSPGIQPSPFQASDSQMMRACGEREEDDPPSPVKFSPSRSRSRSRLRSQSPMSRGSVPPSGSRNLRELVLSLEKGLSPALVPAWSNIRETWTQQLRHEPTVASMVQCCLELEKAILWPAQAGWGVQRGGWLQRISACTSGPSLASQLSSMVREVPRELMLPCFDVDQWQQSARMHARGGAQKCPVSSSPRADEQPAFEEAPEEQRLEGGGQQDDTLEAQEAEHGEARADDGPNREITVEAASIDEGEASKAKKSSSSTGREVACRGLGALLLSFEGGLADRMTESFWQDDREEWIQAAAGADSVEQLSRLLLAIENVLTWAAVEQRWAMERSRWTAAVKAANSVEALCDHLLSLAAAARADKSCFTRSFQKTLKTWERDVKALADTLKKSPVKGQAAAASTTLAEDAPAVLFHRVKTETSAALVCFLEDLAPASLESVFRTAREGELSDQTEWTDAAVDAADANALGVLLAQLETVLVWDAVERTWDKQRKSWIRRAKRTHSFSEVCDLATDLARALVSKELSHEILAKRKRWACSTARVKKKALSYERLVKQHSETTEKEAQQQQQESAGGTGPKTTRKPPTERAGDTGGAPPRHLDFDAPVEFPHRKNALQAFAAILLRMEAGLSEDALEDFWSADRGDWRVAVKQAGSFPAMGAQVVLLENSLRWEAVESSWKRQQVAWRKRTKGAGNLEALATELRVLSSSLLPACFTDTFEEERDDWKSTLALLARGFASTNAPGIAVSQTASQVQAESAHVGKESARQDKIPNVPTSTFAGLLLDFELALAPHAKESTWPGFRPSWFSRVTSFVTPARPAELGGSSDVAALAGLAVELEVNILAGAADPTWPKRRREWKRDMRRVEDIPGLVRQLHVLLEALRAEEAVAFSRGSDREELLRRASSSLSTSTAEAMDTSAPVAPISGVVEPRRKRRQTASRATVASVVRSFCDFLLHLEEGIAPEAFEAFWAEDRTEWIDKVAASAAVPPVAQLVVGLENVMKWSAVRTEWASKRKQWVQRARVASKVHALLSLISDFACAIRPETFSSTFSLETWRQQLMQEFEGGEGSSAVPPVQRIEHLPDITRTSSGGHRVGAPIVDASLNLFGGSHQKRKRADDETGSPSRKRRRENEANTSCSPGGARRTFSKGPTELPFATAAAHIAKITAAVARAPTGAFVGKRFVLTGIDSVGGGSGGRIAHLITKHGGVVVKRIAEAKGNPESFAYYSGQERRFDFSLGDVSTFLITDSPRRTLKFLLALADNVTCVHYMWIVDCILESSVCPFTRYILPRGFSLELGSPVAGLPVVPLHQPLNEMLRGVRARVVGAASFRAFWGEVLLGCGAVCVEDDSTSSPPQVDIAVVEDGSGDIDACSGGALVTTEWVMQCLINQRRLPYDGNERYIYSPSNLKSKKMGHPKSKALPSALRVLQP